MTHKENNTLYAYVQEVLDKTGNQSCMSLINSGFSNIDEELQGLQLGAFYVLGGAAAMGAEKFMGQLALQVADNSGVLYLPQIESQDSLTKRLVGIAGNIKYSKLLKQPWDEEMVTQASEIIAAFKNKIFFLKMMGRFTKEELLSLIEGYVTQNNVQLVIIDNEEHLFRNLLQTLNADEKYDFLLDVKLLLRRLNCCGILYKKIEPTGGTNKNPYQLPLVNDLQKEYDLAALADHIWFLHRLEYYGIVKDGANNLTHSRIDLYVMDEEGRYLSNLYFGLNAGCTGFEVMGEEELREKGEEI